MSRHSTTGHATQAFSARNTAAVAMPPLFTPETEHMPHYSMALLKRHKHGMQCKRADNITVG